MKQFKFRDNTIKLDFNGEIFEVIDDSSLTKKLEAAGNRLSSFIENKQYNSEDDITAELMLTIDDILGDGASGKIFIGRKESLFDCCDVINYIKDTLTESRDERVKEYLPGNVSAPNIGYLNRQ